MIFFLNQKKRPTGHSPLRLNGHPAHESWPIHVICFVSRAGNSKGKGKIIKQEVFRCFHILTLIMIPTVCRVGLVFISMKSKDWREEFIKNFRTWLFALMERAGIQIHNNFHQESPHLSIIYGVFSPPLTKHIYQGKKDLWMLQFGYGQVFPKDGKMTYNFTHTKINKQLSTAWDTVHSAESPVGAHHPDNSLINLM